MEITAAAFAVSKYVKKAMALYKELYNGNKYAKTVF